MNSPAITQSSPVNQLRCLSPVALMACTSSKTSGIRLESLVSADLVAGRNRAGAPVSSGISASRLSTGVPGKRAGPRMRKLKKAG